MDGFRATPPGGCRGIGLRLSGRCSGQAPSAAADALFFFVFIQSLFSVFISRRCGQRGRHSPGRWRHGCSRTVRPALPQVGHLRHGFFLQTMLLLMVSTM